MPYMGQRRRDSICDASGKGIPGCCRRALRGSERLSRTASIASRTSFTKRDRISKAPQGAPTPNSHKDGANEGTILVNRNGLFRVRACQDAPLVLELGYKSPGPSALGYTAFSVPSDEDSAVITNGVFQGLRTIEAGPFFALWSVISIPFSCSWLMSNYDNEIKRKRLGHRAFRHKKPICSSCATPELDQP